MSNQNTKYESVVKTIDVAGNSLSKRIDESNSNQNELFFYVVKSPIKTETNEQGMKIPTIDINIRSCPKGEKPVIENGEELVCPV